MPAAARKADIYSALLDFQKDRPVLEKTAKGVHNTYAPLEQVVENTFSKLNELGVLVIQKVGVRGASSPTLETTLRHVESGTEVESTMLLLTDRATPQGQGSGITYARRYALVSMLGLTSEYDDDGQTLETPRSTQTTFTETPQAIPATFPSL
jgi:hypothetical protein